MVVRVVQTQGMCDSAPRIRQVLLLLSTQHSFARSIVRGVMHFARTEAREPWLLDQRVGRQHDFDPAAYDGILTGGHTRAVAEALAGSQTPIVSVVDWSGAAAAGPLVSIDDVAVGRRAAAFFLARGYTRLAYITRPRPFSQQRLQGFRQALGEAGVQPGICRNRIDERWLETVPKPVGVFAANDPAAQAVVNACRSSGLSVPDDVAVLGVDDDDLLCETTDPPLGSIAVPHRGVGYMAAKRLDALLAGEDVPAVTRLAPGMPVVRRSCDALAVEDPVVRRAVSVLRTRLEQQINVTELAKLVGVSRRTLQARFREQLGHAPLEVLQEYRLTKAASLLRQTDQNLSAIAAACGYSNATRLIEAFERRHGESPTAYRLSGK